MKPSSKTEFKTYRSFTEADEADYAYYRSLTGNQELELMLQIMAPAYEAARGFKRVYRIVERAQR
jgi:hypothetical protein